MYACARVLCALGHDIIDNHDDTGYDETDENDYNVDDDAEDSDGYKLWL